MPTSAPTRTQPRDRITQVGAVATVMILVLLALTLLLRTFGFGRAMAR